MTQAVRATAPIKTNDPQEWLAGVLRERFQDVLAQRHASLDPTQTEGIHDMRVAIRRLRSVIRDCVPDGFESMRESKACDEVDMIELLSMESVSPVSWKKSS